MCTMNRSLSNISEFVAKTQGLEIRKCYDKYKRMYKSVQWILSNTKLKYWVLKILLKENSLFKDLVQARDKFFFKF